MSSKVIRVAVMAGVLAVGLAAMPGRVPVTLAESDLEVDASSIGYDISWPQCGGPYPADPAFGVVGVNAGIVFSPNPCLADELIWAGGADAAFYANTGNPGPAVSQHWPSGQVSPMYCQPGNVDTVECALDYGYNAALDSYAYALQASGTAGLGGSPADHPWWLDVETSNSWRSDASLNVAALRGAVQYLRSEGVRSIGFYSTQRQWDEITGGTATFSAYPSWVAGASGAKGATAICAGAGFTGGGVALVQFLTGAFDGNVRCPADGAVVAAIEVAPATPSLQAGTVQRFAATAYDQAGYRMDPQPTVTWSVSGGGTIDSAGLFTAGVTAGGPYSITASSGRISGTATVVTTAAPDFAVSVSPVSTSITRGQTATFQLIVTPANGFSAPVALSVTGLPSGSKATFSQDPADGTSILTITTSKSTRAGSSILSITGAYGTLKRTVEASLDVTK